MLVVPAYRRALRYGVAAAIEHERTPIPHAPRSVVDVGASRGQFAIVAAQRWPESVIVCFEPLPGPRSKLVRVLKHHPHLSVVDAALSDVASRTAMHISRADDSSSLLSITALQVATFPGTEEVATTNVRTSRLDLELEKGALDRPVLLKIDVQGAELLVLRGAGDLLDDVDMVLVECSFKELYAGQALAGEVVAFLHERGFWLGTIVPGTEDEGGIAVQADLVFSRPPLDRDHPAGHPRS